MTEQQLLGIGFRTASLGGLRRGLQRRREMCELIRGITGSDPQPVEFDVVQFAASWERETIDCQRRYREYCGGDRWGRVPG